MAVAALKAQLQRVIQSMHDEGIVDEHFNQLLELNSGQTPQFVMNLIPQFLADSNECIKEMAALLEQPLVDFVMVTEWSLKIKGSSSCLGAHRVAFACRELREACVARNKEGSLLILDRVKHELQIFQRKLRMILQLERRIYAHAARQG